MNILSSITSSVSNLSNHFASAFDNKFNETKNQNDLISGENGSLAQASAADSSLDFDGILCEYFLLMRGSSEIQISELIDKLMNIIQSNLLSYDKKKEYLIKLLKISLFIREPRKGKGERDVFYNIIEYLYTLNTNFSKKIATTLIDLIKEFGYYKDYNNIYTKTQHNDIKEQIINIYTEQLIRDSNINSEQEYKIISLAAKWAPREGSKYDSMAKVLAKQLITKINPLNKDINGQLKQYRQILSGLNKKLNTVQTFMCQKHWADIDFKNVSSVSMTNLSKAFQDEKVSPYPKSNRSIVIKRRGRLTKISDNRRHHIGDKDYEDREKCRENLFNHIQNGGKVNSSVSNLSQIIENYLRSSNMDITWEAQWNSRITEIQNMLGQLSEKPRIFPMVDLSSSMSGSPIINAITLGLFTSIVMDNPLDKEEFCFANRFMSFASEPQLVKLPRFSRFDKTKPASLKEKVEIMKEWTHGARWGGSTNIHKALDLLLDIATTHKVSQKDMPQILAIFSDMQFDQGDSAWTKTSYDNISDKFKNAGYEVPHILFWNLRSDAVGYQVKADTPNSSMLSGYSTRMLDLFLSGNIDEMKNECVNTNESTYKQKTTLDLLNKALEHEMFEKYLYIFNYLIC